MQHQEGNNVNIIKEGRVTLVPIQRTQPVERKKTLENITEEKDDREEEVETEVGRKEVMENITKGGDDLEEGKAEAEGDETTKKGHRGR